MGPSGAAVCTTVLLFVSLSSTCTDEHGCLQRALSFDDILREMQEPDSGMEQKQVDFKDLLDHGEFPVIEQRMVHPPMDRGLDMTPLRRPPSFGPRSTYIGYPFIPVKFPLSRPTPDNIQAICLHGNHRPRYPDSYFPRSYFSKQKREAAAVNNAETWFSTCCKLNQTLGVEEALCCATLAWEHSVKLFCEEDLSVKDVIYECCKESGNKRLDCFSKDSPNPNYEPTEVLPSEPVRISAIFPFNLTDCSRNLTMTPISLRANEGTTKSRQFIFHNTSINFPPGRPTADNIDPLCANQRLRPLYTTKCLPRSGKALLLALQVKIINSLEHKFKGCCRRKNRALSCANLAWREVLSKYCWVQNGGQVDAQCCLVKKENDRYRCFQFNSPDPHYNKTSYTVENLFSNVCNKNLKRTRFPWKVFTRQCCLLPEKEKSICLLQKLEETSQNLCSSNKTHSPGVLNCCKMQSGEGGIPPCMMKIFTDDLSKAMQVLKQKKICPIP